MLRWWGIDIDPVAVHAAAGNAAMNDLAPTFMVGDATEPGYPLPEADTVVANIALNPILRLARRFGGPEGAAPQGTTRTAPRTPASGRHTSCSPVCWWSRQNGPPPRSPATTRPRAATTAPG